MRSLENRAPPVKVGRVFPMKMFNFESGKLDSARRGSIPYRRNALSGTAMKNLDI